MIGGEYLIFDIIYVVDKQNLQPGSSKKRFYLAFLLLFLLGIGSVIIFRLWQVKKEKAILFSPQQSSFTLKPPSEALIGKFLLVDGDVKKEPRDKEKFETVKAEGEVLIEGEKIATGEKSQATVEFPDFIRIDLGSDAEIGLANLIPANFLITQSSGSVAYKLLQDNAPISVRSLHALLSFNSGEGELTVKEGEIIVKVLSGRAKLALVDLENETHVWELKEGQKALINDIERRVEIE